MKTKNISTLVLLIVSGMAILPGARAQELRSQHAPGEKSGRISMVKKIGDYSYRILPAPNNGFGYIISQNGRIIFKQPPLQFGKAGGKRNFVKMEHADKAAITTIEKIKRGMLPTLTDEEIKLITLP